MNTLGEALNLFHKTKINFKKEFGFDPTHMKCSFEFRNALRSDGDFVLIGTRNVYVPQDGMNRVSPRFFIEDTMRDCVLKDPFMKLVVVDTAQFHFDMMKISYDQGTADSN